MSILTLARSADHKTTQQQPSDTSDCERWYVVHTLPSAEARAELQLQYQGFRTFQPKRYKTVRHARKLTTIESPYFPRYLFIILDLGRDQWRTVNGTFGVSRLVMCGDEPHAVPRGVVEELIGLADEHGILQLGSKLRVGERVRLLAGPFSDQLGILDHLDDAGRVRVLLHILGRQVSVPTNMNNLLPLS